MLVRMNTKTCHYCKQERPTESFVSLRKCAECAATRKCYTCGKQKPIQDFPQETSKGCRECRQSGAAQKKKAARAAADYQQNKAGISVRNKEWKASNAPKYQSQQRAYRNQKRLEIRDMVLERMGGKCACCGEREPLFLTIDHVNGGGAIHRRQIGKTDMWKWLYHNDFPEGFQILCFNCNAGKHRNGGRCPHEQLAESHCRERD
jgi:hypothetical protein